MYGIIIVEEIPQYYNLPYRFGKVVTMYSTTENIGTFFQNEKSKEISTNKCVFANFSQRVQKADESKGTEAVYENWSARFISVACGKVKALNLTNGAFIKLTKWNAHCPYDKESKTVKPYLLVSDFEIIEQKEGEEFVPYEGEELPFEQN